MRIDCQAPLRRLVGLAVLVSCRSPTFFVCISKTDPNVNARSIDIFKSRIKSFTLEQKKKKNFVFLLLLLLSRFRVVSYSVQPQRRQPTRLPHPWDSPGKDTGVGCHFLLRCMKVKSESEVPQSCPIPSDPMDCSLPGSSFHGIFQARVLKWGAIAFSKIMLIENKEC